MKTSTKIIKSTIDLNKIDPGIINLKIAALTLTASYAEWEIKCWLNLHPLIKLLTF